MKTNKNERIDRIINILKLWNILDTNDNDDTYHYLADKIVSKANNSYGAVNLFDVLTNVFNEYFKDDSSKKDKLVLIPLISKLIDCNDESKYKDIIHDHDLYIDEVNKYNMVDSPLRKLNDWLGLKLIILVDKNHLWNEECDSLLKDVRACDYFKLTRVYKPYDDNKEIVEDVYFIKNIDKISSIRLSKRLKAEEFYYLNTYSKEEGYLNSYTGLLRTYKNPYIIKANEYEYDTRLLKGFASIGINKNYDKSSYKAYYDYPLNKVLLDEFKGC